MSIVCTFRYPPSQSQGWSGGLTEPPQGISDPPAFSLASWYPARIGTAEPAHSVTLFPFRMVFLNVFCKFHLWVKIGGSCSHAEMLANRNWDCPRINGDGKEKHRDGPMFH